MGNNSCRSSGSGRVSLREGERNKKVRICCCECGGYKSYSEISGSGGGVRDIGGSGGRRS